MHCSHTHSADCNGATRTHGRRRNKVSETRLPSRGYVEARGEEQNPNEASIYRKIYHGMPGIMCHDAHAAKASSGYESSDLQSLDDSIVRAEMIDADLDAPTPELKILRREEELLESEDACRERRYGTLASFSTRGETHHEASSGLLHKAAWDPRSSQAHKLAHEINDRLNQSEVQMRRLREERDNAVHELMTLSGKITNCTELAEEQAKLLEEQSETISKLETKVQVLEKAKQDARHEQKKKAQALDNVNQRMQSECTEYEEKIQDLENTIEGLRAEQKEHGEVLAQKTQDFENTTERLRAEQKEHGERTNTGRQRKEILQSLECFLITQKVQGLEEENKRMRNELKERAETVQNLEASNKRFRLETEELIQKIQSLEHANQRLQVGTEDHVNTIQNLESTNQRLQGATEEQRQTIQNLENTNQRLQGATEEQRQKLKSLEDTNQRLRADSQEFSQKIQSVEDTNQRLQACIEQHREKLNGFGETNRHLLVEHEQKVRMLEDANQRLQVERDAQIEILVSCLGKQNDRGCHQGNRKTKRELRHLKQKLRSCEGVNQTLRVERDSCKENIRTLEETIQRLRREREECNEKVSSVEESNRVMRTQHKDYTEELQALEETNRRLQFELQNQQETTQMLKDENQHFRMEVLETEERMQVLDHNNQLLQFREKQLQEKIKGLEEHNQLLRVEFTEYIQKLQRSEEEQQRLQAELREYQSLKAEFREQQRLQAELRDEIQRIRSLEGNCRSLLQENTALKEKARNQDDNTRRLKAQHNQEMRRIEESNDFTESEYKKQIAALQEEVELLRAKHTEKTSVLQKNVQQLKEEIIVLEERITDMKAKHKSDNTRRENNNQETEERSYKEVTKLKKCIEDMESRYGEEKAALREQISLHQQRAVIQDEKIEKVMHKMKVAKSELSKTRTREAELKANLEIQETAYQQKLKECLTAFKEIQELTGVNAELREKAEAMDQLCIDNARLVQLLAESEEYQNFLKEMEEGNGLVFCPSQFKGSKFKILAQRYGTLSTRGSVNPKTERENWIPADLYDLAMAFRREHSWEIAVEELQEFLRLVNTFWHEREKKHLVQTKMKYERRISEMKRHHTQRIPYEQVIRSSLSKPTSKGYGSTSSKVSMDSGDHDDGF